MESKRSLSCSKEPLLFPILSQMHPIHTFPPYFPKIHSNIIFPSMPTCFEWSHPFYFSDHNFVRVSRIALIPSGTVFKLLDSLYVPMHNTFTFALRSHNRDNWKDIAIFFKMRIENKPFNTDDCC
jgi:hypothetical protein